MSISHSPGHSDWLLDGHVIPGRPMRLTGVLLEFLGEDLPSQWGCQLQELSKLGVACGHLWHQVQKACLKANPKQRKAELKGGERDERRDRDMYFLILFQSLESCLKAVLHLDFL